jgi:hypothetical protein
MQSLAERPSRGVPFPAEEIRAALDSVAIPGYTGVLQLEIGLAPEAAEHLMIGVIRRQSMKPDQPATTKQTLPDPSRKKPVDKVIADIKSKLRIRPVLTAVEAHYLDGVLQKFTIEE